MVSEKETPGGKAKPETAAASAPTPAPEAVTAAPETTTASTSEAAPEATPAAPVSTEAQAAEIIRKHVLLSAAAGVIPLNFVDTAALAVVQLRLLKELSELHGVDFRGDIGRSAVGTLFATVAPTALAGGLLGSMAFNMALRSVPVIGTVTRLATQPAFNSAFTYALGKVFQQHFASGGTFLTFQPEKVKTYFREKFEEARRRKGATPEAAPAAA
ncbi:YcjF family protein [Azospirillum himalayense]|uniref:YcjF family protein n=1 Tax=Azospirillum himalayense TaxID=654847 RepID=A0ABW0GIB9_9PROT